MNNYLIASYYDGSNWYYLPYVKVVGTSAVPMKIAFNNINIWICAVSFTCATMPPPYPAGQSMILNSVYVDCCEIT
jgi:hypothetical protein